MLKPVVMMVALAAGTAALAEDPAPVTRVSVERRAEATFAKADTNRDTYLSKEEYRAAIVAIAERKGAKPSEKGLAAADAQFDAIDTQHSGRIPRAVFIAAAVAHFDGADINQDGTVTPDEARKAAKIKQKVMDEESKAAKKGK
jgi:hypothetical protein